MQVVCPSGLIVTQRKMRGAELKLLASAARRGVTEVGIGDMLKALIVSIDEPGPYRVDGGLDIRQVCAGDLIAMLIQAKLHVNPARHDVDNRPCRRCGKETSFTVALDEFELKPYPQESFDRLAAGQPLVAELLDGSKVHFYPDSIASGEYVKTQHKQMLKRPEWADHEPTFIDALAGRIKWVELLDKSQSGGRDESKEFVKRLTWLLNMDVDWLTDLQSKMDAQDCGIDTAIEFACEHCGLEQECELPLGVGFFNAPNPTKRQVSRVGTPVSSRGRQKDLSD